MATDQLDTCIIPALIVVELASGSGEFSPYGPVPLRALFKFEDIFHLFHLSICIFAFLLTLSI